MLQCLCRDPLTPRGAVGARHDGLPRQFSPLGCLILSRVHTISVLAALQLPGDLRTAIIML